MVVGSLSVFVLPPDTEKEALATNETWRYLSIAPALFMVIFIMCMLACLRNEAPAFYLYESDKVDKAKESIHKIY